ncbi:AMIN-like domain-containing (lipo)protein [Corynebacterium sp. 32222D000AT]|uniref:AMIN-like domain-containing (lipo)protein n=1 Tax=unclassified Corynebacterium TaxID=2624378 RepID=UPI002A96768A|nr:hypothetical protein [Mycobacteriaceae bacterium]MDY5828537.1 hypothetical protein [Corynebacterium sp.]
MRQWISTLAPLAVAGLVLTGCANDDNSDNANDTSSPSTVTSTSAAPDNEAAAAESSTVQKGATAPAGGASDGVKMLGTPSLDDEQHMAQGAGELVPVRVRTAEHAGFTRMVIEFSGKGPASWFASYTDAPTQQASGYPVEVAGNAFLDLGIEPTPWPSTPELEEQYLDTGSFPGAGVIEEVQFTSAFEAQSQFVVGLKEKVPYSVTYMDGPPRVVIDFAG